MPKHAMPNAKKKWKNGCSFSPSILKFSIAVTGKWVQDVGHSTAPHEAWNEIHPAAKVEKIP